MNEHSKDCAGALRTAGLRVTPQRVSLLTILMGTDDHPNADELFVRARAEDDSVSLATVYRTLDALEKGGLIRRFAVENGPARFEILPTSEHDHIVDIDSGEVVEIASNEIAAMREKLARELGYEIVSQHTLIRARKIRRR